MKTTVERESPTKLRLLIEVEPDELAPLYESTLQRMGREVKIPGFRKGKVPRTVLEARVGKEAIRGEVLRDALPTLYARAADEETIRPVTLPEIEVTDYEEGEPLKFTATVEVRPEVKLPEYTGIEVSRPDTAVTDEDVNRQLDQLRERFGTLEPVARNAAKGDYVTIDLQSYRHDVRIEEGSAQDLVYEVGSGSFVPEMDAELEGKRAGDILKFNAVLPERFGPYGGQEVTFTLIVKEVQAKRLPKLDDEFAKTASEFDTLEELKESIRRQLEAVKSAQADSEVRVRVIEDLVERTDLPLPEAMVTAETEHRLAHFARDLERVGITLEQYVAQANTSNEELVRAYRNVAERAVAAELILEAVAKAEGITIEPEDIDKETARLAALTGRTLEQLREELDEAGTVDELAGDILRRKALDFLVEQAKIAGEER
jgi:trigger factor